MRVEFLLKMKYELETLFFSMNSESFVGSSEVTKSNFSTIIT